MLLLEIQSKESCVVKTSQLGFNLAPNSKKQ